MDSGEIEMLYGLERELTTASEALENVIFDIQMVADELEERDAEATKTERWHLENQIRILEAHQTMLEANADKLFTAATREMAVCNAPKSTNMGGDAEFHVTTPPTSPSREINGIPWGDTTSA